MWLKFLNQWIKVAKQDGLFTVVLILNWILICSEKIKNKKKTKNIGKKKDEGWNIDLIQILWIKLNIGLSDTFAIKLWN